jgi:[protein-PII] uridylyltransferase
MASIPATVMGGSDAIRARLDAARQHLASRLGAGARGVEASAEFAAAHDEIIAELWTRVVEAIPETDRAELSLVATGGWGRGHMAPRSDLDFVLLARRRDFDLARQVADGVLYPLWDARVEVGHAVRDPAEVGGLASEDLATATALLDARHVAGSPLISAELMRAARRAIAPGGNANEFVADLMAERRRRREKFGASIYLLEPNLKHGIGALRDLATAHWAMKARWGTGDLEQLVMMGQISRRQAGVLGEALDFMLKLRALVQLTSSHKTDQLTFEIQEAIAPGLCPDAKLPAGDVRPAVAPAVEALMRGYYLHARGVEQVSDRVLEAAKVVAPRRPRIARIEGSFLIFNGKLAVTDPRVVRERPSEMLRLFRVALDQDLRIYGHTLELIAETTARSGGNLADDPAAAGIFLDLLTDPGDRRQPSLLEEMHQVGLVSALIPEFAPCTCRVQHDLYHVYTVDQHQLYTVALLKRIARGELEDEAGAATDAIRLAWRSRSLHLGALLHDVGKPLGKGHAEKGARIALAVARRLGLDEDEARRTEFLVRQHLTMSHLSQRRDLADPDVIEKFADRVGSEERLIELYLLTYCDTEMTAPGNLTAWKDQLLRELYSKTRTYFRGQEGQEGPSPAQLADRARARALEILLRQQTEDDTVTDEERAATRAEFERLLTGIDDRFFASLTPRQVARHVRLAKRREDTGGPVELAVAHYPLKGHSELALVADDEPGLLATIAGVLAAHRVDVLGAVISTRDRLEHKRGLTAMDLFFVRDRRGESIPADDPRWDRIRRDLTELLSGGEHDIAAAGELMDRKRSRSGLRPRVTPGVPTEVRVLNDQSARFTVVEVFTRDRPGVLYTLARTISDHELDIHLSKVSTEGEKVADVFYVTQRVGWQKVVDPKRVAQLEKALYDALAALQDEP